MTRTEAASPSTTGVPAAGIVETIVPLATTLRTGTALRMVHGELLRRLRANQVGVRDGLPGEYLHDFRVAVRRTRTGLRQLKRVYPRAAADRFADDFQWLSKTTSAARDLEVYLAAFGQFRGDLGESVVGALAPLIAFLRDAERAERGGCRAALESRRYARLLSDWQEFLRCPTDAEGDGIDAARPVREVAAERIEAAYHRVVRRSGELRVDAPAATFHRLRLDCKKLRYLLEFFAALFPGDEGARAIVALRQTQDSLGAINDLRVQADWLARFGVAPSTATRALGSYLQECQLGERREFLARFATFISDDTAAALRGFLRAGPIAH